MDIDLAAFRLNALSLLTRPQTGSGPQRSGQGDFFELLLNAQQQRLPAQGNSGRSGVEQAGVEQSASMQTLLAQLEASNSSFLRRYNARVEAIGDEADVLTRLRSRLSELGSAGDELLQLGTTSTDSAIRTALTDFITRYNQWDSEFDPYFEDGGLLDDNQAGEVARFSLRREVGSIFHGAGNGGFALGLSDMGVVFSADGQLQLDEAAFAAALGNGRAAALQTLHNVASAFSGAARMLAADGHLLDRRIDNAERAVAWAADNQDAVNAEFGSAATAAKLAQWYR